jgi:hypothetical protein
MAKAIILNSGVSALVDDEDYPVISRFSWRKVSQKGYAGTTIQFEDKTYRTYYMHQMILATNQHVDHINGDHLDCRKQNLRAATFQQNGWNKWKPKASRHGESSSQYKGVQKAVRVDGTPYWRVIIKTSSKGEIPTKFVRLGPFASEIDAARAYNEKIVELRGEWAWVNPMPDDAKATGSEAAHG